MQQESLDAYEKVKRWKGEMRHRVYQCIVDRRAATLEDVSHDLQVPKHCISGRITELKQTERIIKAGRTTNSNGNGCAVYAPLYKEAFEL